MTLPASGAIAMDQVGTEIFNSATAPIALGEPWTRLLANKQSGAIGLNDLHGKSVATPGVFTRASGFGSAAYSVGTGSDGAVQPHKIGTKTIIFLGDIGADFLVETDAVQVQSAFNSITINGVTRNTASATFTAGSPGGASSWRWTGGAVGLANSTIYPIIFT